MNWESITGLAPSVRKVRNSYVGRPNRHVSVPLRTWSVRTSNLTPAHHPNFRSFKLFREEEENITRDFIFCLGRLYVFSCENYLIANQRILRKVRFVSKPIKKLTRRCCCCCCWWWWCCSSSSSAAAAAAVVVYNNSRADNRIHSSCRALKPNPRSVRSQI